jgi:hypothetical protein
MQSQSQLIMNRRTLLQATACAALLPCNLSSATNLPASNPRWHMVGSESPNATRFLVGSFSRHNLYPPFLDFPQQHLNEVDAVIISSPYGGRTLEDVVKFARQNRVFATALIDVGGSAVTGLNDVLSSLGNQSFLAHSYSEFKEILGYWDDVPPTLSIGSGTGYGAAAGQDALDTAITLAGFGRGNRLFDVRGVVLTVAANVRTMKLQATNANHRTLRARLSKNTDTLLTLTQDDTMADGALRVTVLVPI